MPQMRFLVGIEARGAIFRKLSIEDEIMKRIDQKNLRVKELYNYIKYKINNLSNTWHNNFRIAKK